MNELSRFLLATCQEGIARNEVVGELLIYDLTRLKAHCGNRSVAAIWKRCDGRTSTKEIAASLAQEVGASGEDAIVFRQIAGSGMKSEPPAVAGGSLFARRVRKSKTTAHPLPQVVLTRVLAG